MKAAHLILVIMPTTFQAYGQTQPPLASQEVETMLITADYWPTSDEHVPSSEVFIAQEQFNTPALSGMERLSQYTSNTLVEESSVQTRIVIRGQSSIDAGLNSPVGYILDDVSLPLGVRQAPGLLNSRGIQVYKGAQGSFYGRNTQAGAIIVDSRYPERSFSGWGQYSFSQVDGARGQEPGHQVQTGISGGNETLAASLAVDHQRQESPYYNQYRQSNDENLSEKTHLQGSIALLPDSDTDILYRTHWQQKDGGRATMRYKTGINATDRFHVNQNTATDHDETFQLHSLRIDRQWDDLILTAITGYTDYDEHFVMDPDSTSLSLASDTDSRLSDEMISQELRLSSADGSAIKWAIGSYFYQQDTQTDFTIGSSGIQRLTTNDQWGAAGFGHVQYPLNDQWTLTGGLRIEHTQQHGHQTGVGVFDTQLTETQWLPKVVLNYQFTPEQSVYTSWSTGYLPGGFNYGYSSTQDNFSYQAEHTQSYEIGHNALWLQKQVETRFVWFYNRIRDKQIADIQPGLIQSISNASKANIYGMESQLNWTIDDSWALNATLGLQHGELNDADNSGADLPYTPDYTWALGLDYHANTLSGSLMVRGSGDYFFDSANQLEQQATEIVDFSLSYLWNPVTFTVAVNNLFDQEIYSRSVSAMSAILVEDTQPRTVSFTAHYTW